MSITGAPDLTADGTGLTVTIVASQWHTNIMDSLIDNAKRTLAEAKVATTAIIRVPGSLEIPLAAQHAAKDSDAIIALGVVIRGETPHFEYVSEAATHGLMSVSLSTSTPIGNGLLTCNTIEQALDRAGLPHSKENKGHEAATAALTLARILSDTPRR